MHLNAPLAVCEQRDPKGLYKKARSGEIRHVTGIDSPYEAPVEAEVVLDTAARDVPACVDEVLDYCRRAELIPAPGNTPWHRRDHGPCAAGSSRRRALTSPEIGLNLKFVCALHGRRLSAFPSGK